VVTKITSFGVRGQTTGLADHSDTDVVHAADKETMRCGHEKALLVLVSVWFDMHFMDFLVYASGLWWGQIARVHARS